MTPKARWVRIGAGVAIWTVLVVTVLSRWEEASSLVAEAGPVFPIAVIAIGFGLVGAAAGWAALQPVHRRRRSARAFLAAQSAKYLPVGGLAQAVSQIGLASSAGERGAVTLSFLVHGAVQVYAACLASLLFFSLEGRVVTFLIGVASVAATGVVFMRGDAVGRAAVIVKRVVRRLDLQSTDTPSTRQLWHSILFTLAPLVLSGSAFGLLAGQRDFTSLVLTTGAFAAAWVAGFLVFPLPSGLGVREAVLVLLLPGLSSAGVVGISLLHRFAALLAEFAVLMVVSRGLIAPTEGPD